MTVVPSFHLPFGASVDQTEAGNAESRIGLGVSVWLAPKKWSSRYESRINRYEWVHAAVPNRSGRSSACSPRLLGSPTPFTQAEGVGGPSRRPTPRPPT